ncbi:MAG: hypothetical protein ACRC3H_12145 [Lachnospiraceae bacterium]
MAKMDSKAVRILNRLLDGGYSSEKVILAMSMDDILALPNVTVADIALVNELQKAIRSNRVIAFLAYGEIKEV